MAKFTINDVDRNLFWEMIDEELVGDYVLHVVEDYFRLICEKLKKDLDITFRYDGSYLANESLNIKIPISSVTSYDALLKQIEDSLKSSSVDNPYGVDTNKLANEWAYSFSSTSMTPYYEGVSGNNCKWKAYDEYSQARLFEAFYFGVFGEFHKDLGFAHDLGKKYLVQDQWNEKAHYKGAIDELDGLQVTFSKNGNITVKVPNQEFIDRLSFFYDICDPKFKNHAK